MLAITALLSASVWVLPQPPDASPQEPNVGQGFARFEADGLAGKYRDNFFAELNLSETAEGFVGNLLEKQIEAKRNGESLVGTATGADGTVEFRAAFAADGRLHVNLGERQFRFQKVVGLHPGLRDLGEPIEDASRVWTIAVYLGGDNDLEASALADIREMRLGLPEQGVEVVVFLDRHRDADEITGELEPIGELTDSRVFRIKRGANDGEDELLLAPGELDSADPSVFGGFVAGAFSKFPAPHHAVVVWDHGGGWQGIVQDLDRNGAEPGGLLTLQSIRRGLVSALDMGLLGFRIDLLAFDACVMAQLEVAVEMTGIARVMVASQANVADSGFPYDTVLPLFADEVEAAVIARGMVAAFGERAEMLNQNSATLAAIDLREVAAVAAALEAVATKCKFTALAQWPAVARALFYAETYEPRIARLADEASRSVDLVDAVQRMQRLIYEFPATAELAALEAAIRTCVIAEHHGETHRLSHGLSVFGPIKISQHSPGYQGTWLSAGTWNSMLKLSGAFARRLASGAAVTVADIAVRGLDGKPASSIAPGAAASVSAKISGLGVVQVQHHDLLQVDDLWIVRRKRFVADALWPRRVEQAAADEVDLVMPQFVDGDNQVSSELFGMQLAVCNGEAMLFGTIDMTAPSLQAPYFVRAQFREKPSDKWTDVVLAFHRALWRVVSIQPLRQPGETVMPREIEASSVPATAEIRAGFEVIAADGTRSLEYTAVAEWKDGLFLVLDADDPGHYRADLVAETWDGRGGVASQEFDLVAEPTLAAWRESWVSFDPDELKGTWQQQLVVGPETWRDTNVWSEFKSNDYAALGCVLVDGKLGENAEHGVTKQRWVFLSIGTPSLRILTEIADHRWYCYYGPAAFGETDGRRFLVMKPVNVPGVIWRWQAPRGGD